MTENQVKSIVPADDNPAVAELQKVGERRKHRKPGKRRQQ